MPLTITERRNIIQIWAVRKNVIKLAGNYIVLHFSVTVNSKRTIDFKYYKKVVLIISERVRPLTDYGITVKTKLLQLGKTQQWLIDEVKKKLPDKYLDTSNMYKILTGEINSRDIVGAINNILNIDL